VDQLIMACFVLGMSTRKVSTALLSLLGSQGGQVFNLADVKKQDLTLPVSDPSRLFLSFIYPLIFTAISQVSAVCRLSHGKLEIISLSFRVEIRDFCVKPFHFWLWTKVLILRETMLI
jgi:hypothetical protein